MKHLRALRALLRVELRQLRRNPGRSWLVAVLVAVPVAAIVGGSTLLRITRQTLEESRAHTVGQADLRVHGALEPGVDVRALLPEDASVVQLYGARTEVRIPGRRLIARGVVLDMTSLEPGGIAEGMMVLDRGRLPRNSNEVALSTLLIEGLGRDVGETVELDGGTPRTVTGVVVDPEDLDLPLAVRSPDADEVLVGADLLVALDSTAQPNASAATAAAALREAGLRVTVREEIQGRDGFEELVIFVIGSLGLLEAALVIAAAFGVGLRRRQREIGLLGSSGAARGGIRIALLASAAVLSLVGAALGVAVGIAMALMLHPSLDGWVGRLNGPFEVSWLQTAGAVLLGVVTGVAAASVPARSATRLPIRVALAGRRPVTQGSHRMLFAGVVTVASGLGMLAYGARIQGNVAGTLLVAGSVFGVLGFGACSPWLLDRLARWAAPLPLAWRLAVRDAGRFRTRNGPVVTAILAGMAISVTVAALLASVRNHPAFQTSAMPEEWIVVDGAGAEDVSVELADTFDAVARAPLAALYLQGELVRASFALQDADEGLGEGQRSWVSCGDAALLDVFGAGVDPGAAELIALRSNIKPDSIELTTGTGRRLEVPSVQAVAKSERVRGPRFMLDREAAQRMGCEPGPPPGADFVPWVVRLAQPLTEEQLDLARSVAAGFAGTVVDADLLHRAPTRDFYRVVLLVCFATGLIVLAVATALSSAESAADARVLTTVGATPRQLRAHLAARTGYLAVLGCLLAIPAGMIPAIGLVTMANSPLELVMPWPEVLVTVFGLPAIAYGGAWLLSAMTDLVRRRPAVSVDRA